MKKKLLFVSNVPPFKRFGGGEHTAEILLNSLKKRFKVSILFWKNKNFKENDKVLQKKLKSYKYFCINKKNIKYGKYFKLLSIFFPIKFFNPYGNEIDNEILDYIEKDKIDFIFLFDYQSLFAFRNYNLKKKIVYSLSPALYSILRFHSKNRFFLSKIFIGFLLKLYLIKLNHFQKYLILRSKYLISNLYEDIQKYKYKFNNHMIYLPMPHEDHFIKNNRFKTKKNKISVVHSGHGRNVMTLLSLGWINKNILPLIIKYKLEDKFNFIILGKYTKEIKFENFSKVNTKYLGFVTNKKYKQILNDCDAYLFTYPFRIYAYVNRIIGALSIPVPIVCTKTVTDDFRLIKNNQHVLSSNDPNILIKNILRLKKDKLLALKAKNIS